MCGIIGFIDRTKSKIDGSSIKAGLSLMNERGSGDGAGYAAYGIYPEYANYYALHVFFDNLDEPKKKVDELLQQWGEIVHQEEIPNTPQMGIKKVHIPWRYFFKPSEDLTGKIASEKDVITYLVMQVNANVKGATIFSSGKNMGVFKASGWPITVILPTHLAGGEEPIRSTCLIGQ